MKIAICDDMEEYRLSIKNYVVKYFLSHHIECKADLFECGDDLISSSEKYDILFLDIELGDSNGIDVAKKLQLLNDKMVIIVITSYRQYLDAAMDIKVARYIDKPITEDRIYSALDKAMSLIDENIITLHIKNNKIVRVKTSEIVYAEVKLRGVTVYCINENYQVTQTLKQLHTVLNASCFATPHGSYIVNLNYIKNFKRNEITLCNPYNDVNISIATRKQPEFKRRFLDFIGEDYKNE